MLVTVGLARAVVQKVLWSVVNPGTCMLIHHIMSKVLM